MNNLKELHREGFLISARVNVDKTNKNSFGKVQTALEFLGLTKKSPLGGIVYPYPGLVYGTKHCLDKTEY